MTPSSSHSKPHLLYIDCLRGYAILMVIACHTAAKFQDLPWRFSQWVSSGWHGVQLFFIASTITLLMSFDHERTKNGKTDWFSFFVRRFFRIAPAYYFAGIIYALLQPNQLRTFLGTISFLTFTNSWIPYKVGQSIVPGGWSVSVEFSFYFLFPFIAVACSTIRMSATLLLCSIAVAIVGNSLANWIIAGDLVPSDKENFIYFSIWNQFPVFALANVFYLIAFRPSLSRHNDNLKRLRFNYIAYALIASVSAVAIVPLPRSFGMQFPFLPGFFATSLLLAFFCVALSRCDSSLLVNSLVGRIGVVSFSAYIWHWLILDAMESLDLFRFFFSQSGFSAIFFFFISLAFAVISTLLPAFMSFRFIESPGITFGRKVKSFLTSSPVRDQN